MLRELNIQEMEMVSGGSSLSNNDEDEVIVVGARVSSDDWVSIDPYSDSGMRLSEYFNDSVMGQINEALNRALSDLNLGDLGNIEVRIEPTEQGTANITATITNTQNVTDNTTIQTRFALESDDFGSPSVSGGVQVTQTW